MKKRYKKEHIVQILKEVASSGKLPEACQKYGGSDATVYNWRKRYDRLEVSITTCPPWTSQKRL